MAHTAFTKVIARNKRATFDYDIERRVMAGIVLKGHEVKSVREGNVSLKNSFANVKDGELWLNNVHIGKFGKADIKDYDPTRARKLLVHRNELDSMIGAKTNGLTIVVLAIGTSGRFLKVELGVARGKKLHDKRQSMKKRSAEREMDRRVKSR